MNLQTRAVGVAAAFSISLLAWAGPSTVPAQGVTPDAEATQAAAWVASQLAAGGDVIVTTGATDWGSTIDAIFALASVGVGGDQLQASAAKLDASGEAYIGAGDAVLSSWSSIAKMTLGLVVAGLDPSAFPTPDGPRNLVDDLASAMQPDGSFGDPLAVYGDNVYSHPLALLALARAGASIPAVAISWLEDQQCTDSSSPNYGSYGWANDCSAPDTDSTAMVVQALEAAGVAADQASVAQALTWLSAQQSPSGGFASSFGGVNANSTGLAAQALGDAQATKAAAGWLGGLQVTCATVASHPKQLSAADLGAIAYDAAGFAALTRSGLKASLTQTTLATVQAVLGLGGPSFATLSADGIQANLPSLKCQSPVAPAGPRTSDTGGAVVTTPGGLLPIAGLLLLVVAVVAVRRQMVRADADRVR